MKKSIYVVAIVFLLLTGCVNGAPASDDLAVPEEPVESLQEKPDALQPGADAADPSNGQEASDAPESVAELRERTLQPPETEESLGNPPPAKSIESYDLADLETSVEHIGDRIANAAVTGDAQKDRSTFRGLHDELELVEDKVDQMEDSIEADVFRGALSRDDYRTLDARLDALEDQLDRMENQLEFLFGFDD